MQVGKNNKQTKTKPIRNASFFRSSFCLPHTLRAFSRWTQISGSGHRLLSRSLWNLLLSQAQLGEVEGTGHSAGSLTATSSVLGGTPLAKARLERTWRFLGGMGMGIRWGYPSCSTRPIPSFLGSAPGPFCNIAPQPGAEGLCPHDGLGWLNSRQLLRTRGIRGCLTLFRKHAYRVYHLPGSGQNDLLINLIMLKDLTQLILFLSPFYR